MLWLIAAETRDSDVNCPDPILRGENVKDRLPASPVAERGPKRRDNDAYLGKAFCYSCGKGPHAWYMMS